MNRSTLPPVRCASPELDELQQFAEVVLVRAARDALSRDPLAGACLLLSTPEGTALEALPFPHPLDEEGVRQLLRGEILARSNVVAVAHVHEFATVEPGGRHRDMVCVFCEAQAARIRLWFAYRGEDRALKDWQESPVAAAAANERIYFPAVGGSRRG